MLNRIEIPEPPKLSSRPSKKYLATAIPAGDGRFFGQWAAPGLIPDFVRDYGVEGDNPPPRLFHNEKEADLAALRTLFNALNNRKRSGSGKSRDTIFEKMTGAELAVAIAEVPGLNFIKTAELLGYTRDYLNEIIDGVKPVPFILNWAIPLLARHDNLEFAESKAAENMKRTEAFVEAVERHGKSPDNLAGRINPRRNSR